MPRNRDMPWSINARRLVRIAPDILDARRYAHSIQPASSLILLAHVYLPEQVILLVLNSYVPSTQHSTSIIDSRKVLHRGAYALLPPDIPKKPVVITLYTGSGQEPSTEQLKQQDCDQWPSGHWSTQKVRKLQFS